MSKYADFLKKATALGFARFNQGRTALLGISGNDIPVGGIPCEAFGASPSASAAANAAAIQAALNVALNVGGLVTLLKPGTYDIEKSTPWLIKSNTRFMCGLGVVLRNTSTTTHANFIRNENWNSPKFPVTAVSAAYMTGGSGTHMYDVTVNTTMTGAAVGKYALIKGDNTGFYDGIHPIVAVNPGISVTLRMVSSYGIAPPAITAGVTKMGISGYNKVVAPVLTGLTRTALNGKAFIAKITTADGGNGAYAQVDSDASGAISQILVSEPGDGYTDLTGAVINMTDGYSGTGVATWPLANIATPMFMSISLADANIEIDGGAWDWNAANVGRFNSGDQSQRCNLIFNKVANLKLHDFDVIHCDLQSIIANSQNTQLRNITAAGGGGFALAGPCYGAHVMDVRTTTADDAVSFSVCTGVAPQSASDDYSILDMPDQNGPIQDVTYDSLRPATSINRVLLSPGRGFVTRGIRINFNNGVPNKPHTGPSYVRWNVNRKMSNAAGYSTNTIYVTSDPKLQGLHVGMRVLGLYVPQDSYIQSIAPTSGQPQTDGWTYAITLNTTFASFTQGSAPLKFMRTKDTPKNEGGVTIATLASAGAAAGPGTAYINDVIVSGISGDTAFGNNTVSCGAIAASTCSNMEVGLLHVEKISNTGYREKGSYITIAANATVKRLRLRDTEFNYLTALASAGDNNLFAVDIFGTVEHLDLGEGVSLSAIGVPDKLAGMVRVNAGGVLGKCTSSNACLIGDADHPLGVILVGHYGTASATKYHISDIIASDFNCLIAASQSCDVDLHNPSTYGSSNSLLNFYGSARTHNVAVGGINNQSTGVLFAYGTGNTINLRSSDGSAALDGTKVTPSSGALFYNTNAAYGAGVGLYAQGAAAATRIAA